VLAKVDSAMAVAQEEIFGPVVTVIPFQDEA
jgi:aldehyde dehydrogenase (NAD+)